MECRGRCGVIWNYIVRNNSVPDDDEIEGIDCGKEMQFQWWWWYLRQRGRFNNIPNERVNDRVKE